MDKRSPRSQVGILQWKIVRCLDCGHQWDEHNPDDEVCACLDKTGSRRVEVISEGATNIGSVTL